MSVGSKIADDLKEAMKSGDKVRVSVLRMIRSEIKNREIDKGEALSDDDIMAVVRSFSKKAKDSIEQFSAAGRTDLSDKEEKELAVIESYLPAQLSDEDLKTLIKDVIAETGAGSMRDMGKVMKAVMAKAQGQADGKTVNSLVKEVLGA